MGCRSGAWLLGRGIIWYQDFAAERIDLLPSMSAGQPIHLCQRFRKPSAWNPNYCAGKPPNNYL